MRRRGRNGRRLPPAAAIVALALSAGCTLPLTTQTLTGGALNAGALLFVDHYNDDIESRGAYRYEARAGVDTLAAIFKTAIEEANRAHLFRPREGDRPRPPERPVAEGGDGVVLARAPGNRRARRDDPPPSETFPRRQWTPSPRFMIQADSPVVRGDTLKWVVTHRSAREVAFMLVRRSGDGSAHVAIVPYDPPNDVFLSVATDHAQRNAVESLHETFYFAVVERLGPTALAGPSTGAGS
ncbi:MAG: hypothetical protein ACODAA_01505 [Gemmatimonadota bacterium]